MHAVVKSESGALLYALAGYSCRLMQYRQLPGKVDLFLYDYKESDPIRHREFASVPPGKILDNLRRLDDCGAALILRCPIIPGYNASNDHFQAIAALANGLRHIREVSLIPYHPLGESKYNRLGRQSPLPESGFPDEVEVNRWLEIVSAHTRVPVKLW